MAGLGDLILTVGANITGFKQAMGDVSSTVTSTANTAEGALSKLGGVFTGVFESFSSLGAGWKLSAAGITAGVIELGREFQDASVKISRATGQTGGDLAALNQSFMHLYVSSASSAEAITEALSRIAVESKTTGDALEGLTAANLRFAKVAGVDVAQSVDQTQILFKQFGIATADQADALDVLYAAMTDTGVSLAGLSGEMAAIGPTARAFGMSFLDTAALVGAFQEAGLKASEMTRGLNALFAKFAESGKAPTEALAEFIERIKQAKTETEAVNYAVSEGFVKRSAVPFVDAVRRGAFELGELMKKLSDSKGKVKEVADETKTFGGELTKLGHQMEQFGGALGTPVVTAFTAILMAINDANGAFATWEANAAKWLRDKGTFSIVGPAFEALNNTFNPFATGNYINRYFAQPPGPQPPKAALAPSLTAASAAGGGLHVGLSDDQAKKDFGALGIKDLEEELNAATKAFNELTAAHRLNDGQVVEATAHITELRAKLAELRAGYGADGPPKATQDLMKTLGIGDPDAITKLHDVSTAFLELQKRKADFAGPQSAEGVRLNVDAWTAYGRAVNAAKEAEDARKVPFFDAVEAQNQENAALQETIDALNGLPRVYNAITGPLTNLLGGITGVTDAFHYFNIKTPAELQKTADEAKRQYEIIKTAAGDSAAATQIAWTKATLAQIELDHQLGIVDEELYNQRKKNAEDALKTLEGTAKDTTGHIKQAVWSASDDMKRAMGSAFDSAYRALGDSFVHWKDWGKNLKSVVDNLASDMASTFLKAFFKPVEDAAVKLAGKLGTVLGGIWGPGGSAAGTAASTAGGAASSGGGAAGAAVSTGLMGTIGAVGSVVSAISGVIGNFQNAHQETSLNAIEHNTRYLEIIFEKFAQQDEWDRQASLFHKLDDMWNEIRNVVSAVKQSFTAPSVALGAAGASVYVDLRGSTFGVGTSQQAVDTMMQTAYRRAKAALG